MTGGAGPRRKGDRRERFLVALHQSIGVDCERYPLSGESKFRGSGHDLDVYAFGRDAAPLVAEVKARKNAAGFVTLQRWLSDYDLLILCRDRSDPLIVLPWRSWKGLLERIRQSCDICGGSPCNNPSFCARAREADRRRGRAKQAAKAAPGNGGRTPDAESTKPKPRPDWRQNAVNFKELQTMIFNPITFLVPGLIPAEGTTLICSKPKVGKSWLLLDIALSSTLDRYVLGQLKATQGDALFLALEDGLRRLQGRGTKLLPTFIGEWPEGLTVMTQWRRVDQGGLDDMREWVEETRQQGRKVAFIAVDVLKMIRPRHQSGKQPYDADYEAIAGLRRLSLDLGVPIIIAHHTRKAEAEDLLDKVSGTLGLVGAADTIIVIERQSRGTIFDVRGRDIESESLAVEFRKDTCRWTILGDAATVQHSAERERVLDIFRNANEPLTPKSVTEQLESVTPREGVSQSQSHFSETAVRKILSRMHANGDLRRPSYGKYTLPVDSQSHSHSESGEGGHQMGV